MWPHRSTKFIESPLSCTLSSHDFPDLISTLNGKAGLIPPWTTHNRIYLDRSPAWLFTNGLGGQRALPSRVSCFIQTIIPKTTLESIYTCSRLLMRAQRLAYLKGRQVLNYVKHFRDPFVNPWRTYKHIQTSKGRDPVSEWRRWESSSSRPGWGPVRYLPNSQSFWMTFNAGSQISPYRVLIVRRTQKDAHIRISRAIQPGAMDAWAKDVWLKFPGKVLDHSKQPRVATTGGIWDIQLSMMIPLGLILTDENAKCHRLDLWR